jgi:hypothetical protein
MVHLGYEAQLEGHFGPFGESANLDARLVQLLWRKYLRLGNHFWRNRWNSSVTWFVWNLVSVRLEMMLVSVQHRCMVCAKRTICSEITLEAPNGTPR